MRFSFLQKEPTNMYFYNAFNQTPAVVPLTMEAFVAPENFDPDAQELNIVKAFAAYPDANKKYIFSVGTSTTTVLPVVAGRSYAYSQNGGAYTTIASGTVTWTVGSTKRNVVVLSPENEINALVPVGAIWVFCDLVNGIYSNNNTYLKYIHFNKLSTLKFISDNAFSNCSQLTSVNIPISVDSIGTSAFSECNNLVFNNNSLKLNLNTLGDSAFWNCRKLANIDLSESTFSSCHRVFTFCSALVNISLPNTLAVLTNDFYACTSLTSIVIPISVTSIISTFDSCTSLKNIIIPPYVTIIGSSTFHNCTSLTSINIPNSVTSIGIAAFQFCSALTSINIPISVTSIGAGAFEECSNLVFNNNNLKLNLNTLGASAFWNCRKLANIDLSESTFSTCPKAFTFCTGLINLSLPNTLAVLTNDFYACTSLTSIKIQISVPVTITTSDCFYNVNKTTCILHVPVGSLAAYQAAPYWNEFTNIIADL